MCWHVPGCISKIQNGRQYSNPTLYHIKKKKRICDSKRFVVLECTGFQIYLIVIIMNRCTDEVQIFLFHFPVQELACTFFWTISSVSVGKGVC